MTTRTRTALLIALAIVAFILCACLGDDGERSEWQREVLSRQRGLEQPAATPQVAERTDQ